MNETYPYPYSAAEARKRNELSLWRESYKANIACRNAIEEAIRQNFDGMHLDKNCITPVLEEYGYVAIFEGMPIQPAEPANVPSAASAFRWSYVLIPLGIVAAAGAGVGGALLVKHRKENADEEETEE